MARLFMLLIGCKPPGRNVEQHDVLFCIGESIRDIIPQVLAFWPEAKGKLHFDAWREVTKVDGYSVKVIEKKPGAGSSQANGSETGQPENVQLFFLNLGGYKPGEFEEFHYKMIIAAADKGEAVKKARRVAFFQHTGFKGANAHIDERYGVDVDDFFAIPDILPPVTKGKYSLEITPAAPNQAEDVIHLGYFRLENVEKWDIIHSDSNISGT